MRNLALAAVLAAAMLLSACGGGGDDGRAGTDPPDCHADPEQCR